MWSKLGICVSEIEDLKLKWNRENWDNRPGYGWMAEQVVLGKSAECDLREMQEVGDVSRQVTSAIC